MPNRLQLDTTLGSQRSGPARDWMTLGLRILF